MLVIVTEQRPDRSRRSRVYRLAGFLVVVFGVTVSWVILAEYILHIERGYWLRFPLYFLLIIVYWIPAWGAIGSRMEDVADTRTRWLQGAGCLFVALVVFLLICSMPGRLLATVRSRCRFLMLQPLGHDDLEAAARQAMGAAEVDAPAIEDWPALMMAAGGSVRRLLTLAGDNGAVLARRVDELLDHAVRGNWSKVHQVSDALSGVQAVESFEAFVELLTVRLAGIIHAAATGQGEATDVEVARRLRVGDDLASWAELWETLVRERALQGALNLDRKGFLLEAARRLGRLSGRG